MTRSDLPQNQIVPVARPLDSFIQPARQNVAEPLRPQMMPEPGGMRIIPQASGGNVQGVNQFMELAQALRPFGDGLISLGGAGLKLYATNEYEKGRTEAMRAQVLANQQMLASGAEYAAENRKLDRVDPIGALMMDRVNPFRAAGRQNALSRVAGSEIQRAVLNAYRMTPEVAELPLESPALMQLHAQAVEGVTKKYRLDSGSPGFIEYVLPEIGQAQQKLFELHAENHSKHLKETAWRQSAAEAVGAYVKARESGVVEWQEFDPATGQPVRRVARLAENRVEWERGVQFQFRQIANRLANETGITGETAVMQRRMYERMSEMAGEAGNEELVRLLKGSAVGPPGKDGFMPTVGSLYGIEMLEGNHKISQIQWQRQQQQTEQGLQQFQSELANLTYGMEDGPARGAAIQGLVKKYADKGVPLGKLYEATQGMSKTLDEVAGRSYDSSGVDALLQDMQGRVGGNWNAAQADREFESSLAGYPPAERDQARRRYAEIRAAKEREKADMPDGLINPLLSAWMKSNLRARYPSTATEAALRSADISAMLAWGDANVAESSKRQLVAGRRHVYSRIQEAMTRKGGRLDATEVTEVTSRALEEYGQKNKEALEYLFPGVGDEPSVGGAKPQPHRGGQRSGGGGSQPAATPTPVFSSGQLDNMPNRANRLKAGEVVMDLPSVQEEVTRMMNGRSPSAAAMRAARDAGFGGNVGRWLMQQADGYRDSFRIPEGARQQLLRSSRDAEGMANAIAAATRPVTGAVELAGRSLMDALLGVTPSYAAPQMAMRGGGRNGGAPFTGRGMAMIGTINVNSLRQAIVGKESGGNFSAVNPDSGALGYGQVMPYNVGPWTQKHYGRRLTPQQFLSNREAQIAVVDGEIGEIVRQQLAAGYKGDIAIRRAAAIWYSGNGNLYDDNKPQFSKGRRYPSVREYTLDILNRYRRT